VCGARADTSAALSVEPRDALHKSVTEPCRDAGVQPVMKALIVSFVTHLAVIGAVLLGSVVAPETMPRLLKRISPPILASIVPPHDVALQPRPKNTAVKSSSTVTGAAVVNVASDPVVTPNRITPESGNERSGTPGGGVVDGVAGMSEIGTIAAPAPLPAPAPNKPVRLH